MELVTTIINELTDINISLTAPLLKTKVLANRMQNHELLQWVNNELAGYTDLKALPDYRKTTGDIYGDYLNGRWNVKNQAIPLPKFEKEVSKNLYSIDLCQSIQTLESFNTEGESYIAEFFSGEQKRILQEYLESQNPHLQIFNLYRKTPSNFILDILSNVRNKLLDFMLRIEQEYEHVSEIKQLRLYNENITKIMHTTINNNGDGNVVNTGNNASLHMVININKGDKEALKIELLNHGIQTDDVEELLKIVDLQKPNSKDQFGSQVSSWIGKMITKAIDGSWQIGIGAAGNVIATALQQYYGIS